METSVPPSPVRFEDDADSSSVSDYDSEWTQVSQSEDESDIPLFGGTTDGSVSQFDSDSLDGDAWEAMSDGLPETAGVANEQVFATAAIATSALDSGLDHSLPPEQPVIEDDRQMMAALDNSLSGTLECARTRPSACTPDGSMMESQSKLRLSFPDPLFRSTEDISRSYETVKTPRKKATSLPDSSVDALSTDTPMSASMDTGLSPTPDVADSVAEETPQNSIHSDFSLCFSISLYGFHQKSCWDIAEKLLELAFPADDVAMFSEDNEHTRIYRVHSIRPSVALWRHVKIINRPLPNIDQSISTGDSRRTIAHDERLFTEPSLAVINYPFTTLLDPPDHTFYLPIYSSLRSDPITTDVNGSAISLSNDRKLAEESWKQLGIGADRVLRLQPRRPEVLLDESQLDDLDKAFTSNAFARLLGVDSNRCPRRPSAIHGFTRRYAGGLLLLTALTAGLLPALLNTPARTTGTAANLSTVANCSAATPSPVDATAMKASGATAAALIPLSLKDYALAVLQPSSLVPSESGVPSRTCDVSTVYIKDTPTPLQRPAQHDCHCRSKFPSSSGAALAPSTDLVVRPASTLHLVEKPPSRERKGKAGIRNKGTEEKSINTHVLGPISEIVNVSAVAAVVNKDMQALLEAIDELIRALDRQIVALRYDWDGVKRSTRRAMSTHNKRAKENAKKIKENGERLLKSASVQIKKNVAGARDLMDHARQRAKTLRKEGAKSATRLSEAQKKRAERRKARLAEFEKKRKERQERKRRRAGKDASRVQNKGVFNAEVIIEHVAAYVF
ncbi:hypothetical protein BD410DRAFT_784901 [Rickenella mellea]|uniref:Uncharacterized protein n=1 Tax=Rickenella mellea TaxID=50990 RepID=A0A4Y7QEU8_9AGAM|nr:hypothetical protein BD410DRAFT_784901 [Rickenella mellea]